MTIRILYVALVILFLAFPICSILLLNPTPAHAADCPKGAGGFVPLECFQDSAKLRDAYQTDQLGPFLQKLFVGAISLGAILAVLRLAWAGFMYMGSDMWGKKEHAKEIIRDTLLGLFLLLAIWLILNQINPEILKLKINTQTTAPEPQTGLYPGPR